MAKHRYGSKKSAKRVAAGKRLGRYSKLAAKIGKRAAYAQVFGGKRGKAKKGSKKSIHRGGKSAKRVAAGRRLFAKMAARHGGVAKYKAILRARLARARRAR